MPTYDLIRDMQEETNERPTHTIEDYLQLIYTMHREGEDVIAARIKERKNVSAPTAWATLKRMERDNLVTVGADHRIDLTEDGRLAAESIIRRHMLAERLLTDILKLNWADVHEEAHRVEHAISPLIEKQILLLLDSPTTCPHGNPIPGLHDISGDPDIRPLRDVRQGEHVTINNIAEHAEDDSSLMHFLERNRLVPGVSLVVEEVALSNSTITVRREDDGETSVVGLHTADLFLTRTV